MPESPNTAANSEHLSYVDATAADFYANHKVNQENLKSVQERTDSHRSMIDQGMAPTWRGADPILMALSKEEYALEEADISNTEKANQHYQTYENEYKNLAAMDAKASGVVLNGVYGEIQEGKLSQKSSIETDSSGRNEILEQVSQHDQKTAEYLQEYPDAVVDPIKAELMAYASKQQEERAATYKKRSMTYAEDAAKSMGPFSDDEEIAQHTEKANQAAEVAQLARERADRQAQVVGDTYDKIKNI